MERPFNWHSFEESFSSLPFASCCFQGHNTWGAGVDHRYPLSLPTELCGNYSTFPIQITYDGHFKFIPAGRGLAGTEIALVFKEYTTDGVNAGFTL